MTKIAQLLDLIETSSFHVDIKGIKDIKDNDNEYNNNNNTYDKENKVDKKDYKYDKDSSVLGLDREL